MEKIVFSNMIWVGKQGPWIPEKESLDLDYINDESEVEDQFKDFLEQKYKAKLHSYTCTFE